VLQIFDYSATKAPIYKAKISTMKKWHIIEATIFLAALLTLAQPVPAEQVSADIGAYYGSLFGVATGFDYQNRNFESGDYEYDLNYSGLIIRPMVNLTNRWSVFLRLGYSRLAFDRPEFGGTDYDEWGFEYGGGSTFTLLHWSIFRAGVEGECSYLNTDRKVDDGGEEIGRYLHWRAGAEAGVDLEIVYPYIGCEYNDGRITHKYSSPDQDFSNSYDLKNRWKTFVGIRIKIPPFTSIQGQYYFGKDLMTMMGVGFSL
jgi:hypothetical protein